MKTGYDQFFKQARKARDPVRSFSKEKRAVQSPKLAPKAQVKKKTSSIMLIFSLFGILVTGAGYLYLEDIETFVSKVELSLGVPSQAEEVKPEKTSTIAAGAAETVQAPAVAEAPVPDFVKNLTERKKELDQKEEELKKLEAEIEMQNAEVEKKLLELQRTREEISKTLETRVELDSQRVDALVQVYQTMKPQQAAKIMETLDQQLLVEILGKMKKKNAAEIMNVMKPEKVQAFSEQYAGYRAPSSTAAEKPVESAP